MIWLWLCKPKTQWMASSFSKRVNGLHTCTNHLFFSLLVLILDARFMALFLLFNLLFYGSSLRTLNLWLDYGYVNLVTQQMASSRSIWVNGLHTCSNHSFTLFILVVRFIVLFLFFSTFILGSSLRTLWFRLWLCKPRNSTDGFKPFYMSQWFTYVF